MNKKSNIFKNITTVLMALLILGLVASTGNAGTSNATVGNINATLTDNTSYVNRAVNINFTINDTVNATSWYNITFPADFNAGGVTVNVTINGTDNPANWTRNINGILFVNVSSNATNVAANKSTIQYINLSNITTPSYADTFIINISTNNTIDIPLNCRGFRLT